MRNLIHFLVKNSSLFFFILLELVCFYFIFSSNSYQKSVFFNSSNQVCGKIYSASGNFFSYFGLKKANEELLVENVNLSQELAVLKYQLSDLEAKTKDIPALVSGLDGYKQEYEFILSKVVNNSTSRSQNYITLNKGTNNGVEVDMGVISHNGIVGQIIAASDNYSIVLPILHPKSRVVCKVLKSNAPATLIWNGKDPRYATLIDYPKFELINKGDTIITTGFSAFYPEGILVGTVDSYKDQADGNFYSLKVKLSTDFTSLKDVLVINNKNKNEKQELERKVRDAQK